MLPTHSSVEIMSPANNMHVGYIVALACYQEVSGIHNYRGLYNDVKTQIPQVTTLQTSYSLDKGRKMMCFRYDLLQTLRGLVAISELHRRSQLACTVYYYAPTYTIPPEIFAAFQCRGCGETPVGSP